MNLVGKAALDRTIIILLAALYLVQQFTHWKPLIWVLGCLVFIALALLLPLLRGMTLWLTASFMTIGMLFMLLQKSDAQIWMEAAGMNATLVTLFVFAPLFGIPVRIPNYVESLKRFYQASIRTDSLLVIGTQLLTQTMGVFINVGSISVVHHLAFVQPRSDRMSRLLAGAMNRGFAGAIFWSPYFAAMAIVTTALSLRWSTILPYMLGLSLLGFLASAAVDFRELRNREDALPDEAEQAAALPGTTEKRSSAAFPAELAVYLISAIAVILALEHWIKLPMVLVTCIAAVLFPLLWCWAKGFLAIYRQGAAHHVMVVLPAMRKEIALFLAAGFFSGSIGETGFGASLPDLLALIPLPISISFSLFTVLLITVASLLGIHPIVPVAVIANGIDPASVHIGSVHLAVLLLGSWGISNTISPASAVNNLLAGLYKKSVFELAALNYKFAAFMGVALLGYLFAVF